MLASLTYLDVHSNKLSGSIPKQIGNLTKLIALDMDTNQLDGTIPEQIGQLTHLTAVILFANQLSGTIPSEIGNLQDLLQFNIYDNNINGTIPPQIGNLKSSTIIFLFSNEISGTIPTQIGLLINLQSLDLSKNKISGNIPTEIGNMINLTALSFFSNQLEGTIPSQIGNLAKLSQLNLSFNLLSGTLPETILDWTVPFLYLDNNLLTGGVHYPRKVQLLSLSNNSFSSFCFDILFDESRPYFPDTIILSHNNITFIICDPENTIQVYFANIIRSLDLSYNNITSFPTNIHSKTLEDLRLINCGLTGPLQEFFNILQRFPFLNYLDISNNSFTGFIPPLQTSLSTLILSNNNITGELPTEYPSQLRTLMLSNNDITGFIPSSLANLGLTTIDLSQTKICADSFPSEWIDKKWLKCNLQIPYPCDIPVPSGCVLSDCGDTVRCFMDQCSNRTHSCDQRACILNSDWSYTCGECPPFYKKSDDYNCSPSDNLIMAIAIPLAAFVIIVFIIIIVILYFRNKKLNLFLPHNWLWEISYLEQSGYQKSTTDPFYYRRTIIDVNNPGRTDSKEYKLFRYLKQEMEFDEINITKVIAISAIHLAQRVSTTRIVLRERFKSDPETFKNQKWMKEANSTERTYTMEHFKKYLNNFEWNMDLDTDDAPVLPVAHGTRLRLANKIIAGGFAKLNTLDDGYYGKGIYFSTSALYTLPYCITKSDPCIVLSFLLPGNPYPVIENPKSDAIRGKPILGGYQSHYVVTSAGGMPLEEKDSFKYRSYNEIVIDQESQVVPIFIVQFDNKKIPPALDMLANINVDPKKDSKLHAIIRKSNLRYDDKSESDIIIRQLPIDDDDEEFEDDDKSELDVIIRQTSIRHDDEKLKLEEDEKSEGVIIRRSSMRQEDGEKSDEKSELSRDYVIWPEDTEEMTEMKKDQ